MTAHDHREYVEGCFRCDLSADEEMGFCNACGEEAELNSECCDDGEVWPYDDPDPSRLPPTTHPLRRTHHDH